MFQIQNHHYKNITCHSAVIAVMHLFFVPVLSLLFTCSELGKERTWNNPLDPGGSGYFIPSITVSSDTAKISYPGRVFNATATATDSNDTKIEFVWKLFNGWIKRDTGITSTISHTFTISDTGTNLMCVYARDSYGRVSKIDTLRIVIRSLTTVLTPINDMTVKQDTSLKVKLTGSVNEGPLTFLYDSNNDGVYESTTLDSTLLISKPEGGLRYVHWAIRDESGTTRYDTFTVYFNKAPFPPVVILPEDTIKKLLNYDYEKATGSVKLEFSARDSDDVSSTLTYQLQYYRPDVDTFNINNLHDSIFQLYDISASSVYHWKITVRDSSGNTSHTLGHFITAQAPAPPAGMKLIKSKGRKFYMGQQGYDSTAIPLHAVTFTRNFWMDSTEVTCRKFAEVLSLANFPVPTPKSPVANITWFDAVMYCNALSKRDSLDTCYSYISVIGTAGNHCQLVNISTDSNACGYRLPTEAQWEYACRGGTSALYFWGNDRIIISQYAWSSANSGSVTHDVASLKANPFGLYDISGNVWEWCNDWFDRNYYRVSVNSDPAGPHTGTERVVRGGSSTSHYYFSQSGTRSNLRPDHYNQFTGFRTVLVIQ
ncbi:MAG: SUMF1/EgtB/PvdO family nonheme iron enzyme [Chitinispirillaceae bacterium]|nr:SUMF1/EgtB/PvdO family nonheme iron enzyme [Chitinispirillaceae bacterium]